jgi:hypothetical protein
MHGPQLRLKILELKLRLDFSRPEEVEALLIELDEHYRCLQLITKEPLQKLKSAIDSQYPDWAKDEIAKIAASVSGA